MNRITGHPNVLSIMPRMCERMREDPSWQLFTDMLPGCRISERALAAEAVTRNEVIGQEMNRGRERERERA